MSAITDKFEFSNGVTSMMRAAQLCIMFLGGCMAIVVVVIGTMAFSQSWKDDSNGPGFNSSCPVVAGFTCFYLALAFCQVVCGYSQSQKTREIDGGTLLVSFFCGCFCNVGIMIAWTVLFVREIQTPTACGLFINSHPFLRNAIIVELGFGWIYAGLPFIFFVCFCGIFLLGACCEACASRSSGMSKPTTTATSSSKPTGTTTTTTTTPKPSAPAVPKTGILGKATAPKTGVTVGAGANVGNKGVAGKAAVGKGKAAASKSEKSAPEKSGSASGSGSGSGAGSSRGSDSAAPSGSGSAASSASSAAASS